MEVKKILISDKKELKTYKVAILELFEKTFSRKLSELEWEWAYIKNPNGSPVVSLYFDEDKLVGHYAIIPIKLKLSSPIIKPVLAGLSMTTMVDSRYRRYGFFIQQANEVFLKAKSLGYCLVYGFPNKKSAPGFVKRLGWTLDKSYVIARVQKNFILDNMCIKDKKSMIEFDFFDDSQKKWRLSKPGLKYSCQDGLVTKPFNGGFDILYFNGDCDLLVQNEAYNILTTTDVCLDNIEITPYIFGYKFLNEGFKKNNIDFKVDLIMSDIF